MKQVCNRVRDQNKTSQSKAHVFGTYIGIMSCLQESTHEFILKLIRLETADPKKAENYSSRQPGKTQKNAQRNWKCEMINNTINRTNIAQTVPSGFFAWTAACKGWARPFFFACEYLVPRCFKRYGCPAGQIRLGWSGFSIMSIQTWFLGGWSLGLCRGLQLRDFSLSYSVLHGTPVLFVHCRTCRAGTCHLF